MKKSKEPNLENGIDFISQMPDVVLELILQCLPNTVEVVRTSVLSTRWRYVWKSISHFPSLCLNIDCDPAPMTPPQAKNLQDFVSWALADKTLDLDSFRLRCSGYHEMATVWQWIDAAMTRKVKKLDLMFCNVRITLEQVMRIELPPCLVNWESLESLRLCSYVNRVSLPDCKGFSALTTLELNNVAYGEAKFLEKVLKMCPLIEKLSLIECDIAIDIGASITCLKLKTLIIHCHSRRNGISRNGWHLVGVVSCPELVFFESIGLYVSDPFTFLKRCPLLEDIRLINCIYEFGILEISCPRLKTLIIHQHNSHYCYVGLVVSCPQLVFFECVGLQIKIPFIFHKAESLKKAVILRQSEIPKESYCKVLARISHVEYLSLDCSSIRYACDPEGKFPESLPNLKTLELTTAFETYDTKLFVKILTCSPNLESIHMIIQEVCSGSKHQDSDRAETMRILSPFLKRVEFVGFERDEWKLEIVELLLRQGNALEKMIFSWCNEAGYHEKSMETLNDVSKFHRASSSVKLVTLLKKL